MNSKDVEGLQRHALFFKFNGIGCNPLNKAQDEEFYEKHVGSVIFGKCFLTESQDSRFSFQLPSGESGWLFPDEYLILEEFCENYPDISDSELELLDMLYPHNKVREKVINNVIHVE